jgi:tetratricopeptide (TPR) repeat protein
VTAPRRIRVFAWILPALSTVGILAASGCAPWAGPRIRETASGQYVVEVGKSMGFDELAKRVYGDADLGPAIAALNNLPYEEGVPRRALLVLPPRESLQGKLVEGKAADAHFHEGLASVDAGNFREGADHFREALRANPGRVDVLYNLGLALDGAGELEESTQALREAARRRPDDPEIRYALGSVLRRRGAYQTALDEFEAALDRDREHSKSAFARARTLEDLKRTEDARRAWREFLERFPESPWAPRARESLQALEDDPLEEDRSGS